MGIYVPSAYLTKNSDGSFSINSSGTCNGYTAATAPIVVPVNTSGYSAQSAPSGTSSTAATYTDEGFIYLRPGCRGRSHGAPLGVTDLKAAVRYFRYLSAQSKVPGNTDLIFSFGHSGGGAQSAIFGTSGNSSLYDNLRAVIGYIRQHLVKVTGDQKYARLPVICGTYAKGSRQRSPKVVEALYQLANDDSDFYVVDASDLTLLSDKLHFDARGAETLGQRVFDKLMQLSK